MADDKNDEWVKRAGTETQKKMGSSAMMVGLATDEYLKDPLCALQLGYAILMDKPILLIAARDTKLPAALVRAALRIERADIDNKAEIDRAMRAIIAFGEQHVSK